MAYGTINADVIQSSVTGVSLGAGNATRFKNRIINGDMRIDQRNAGASITPAATTLTYNVDRWNTYQTQASKFTIQQNAGSVTPPVGFNNYLGATSSSAYSVTSTDQFNIRQYIEGFNFADLGWGTANAKTVTLSAWVYSSLTGTFGGSFTNYAFSRSYPFTYTISSANTWTQISVTIPGDTSGTWVGATSAGAAALLFNLGCGSTLSGTAGAWASAAYCSATGATSVVGTNGATFYITGVQLEVGSSATGFEYVDYTTQLAMCQRYYYTNGGNNILSCHPASIYARINYYLPVNQRTSGTTTFKDAVGNSGKYTSYSTSDTATNNLSAIAFFAATPQIITLLLDAGDSGVNAGLSYTSSAEL